MNLRDFSSHFSPSPQKKEWPMMTVFFFLRGSMTSKNSYSVTIFEPWCIFKSRLRAGAIKSVFFEVSLWCWNVLWSHFPTWHYVLDAELSMVEQFGFLEILKINEDSAAASQFSAALSILLLHIIIRFDHGWCQSMANIMKGNMGRVPRSSKVFVLGTTFENWKCWSSIWNGKKK